MVAERYDPEVEAVIEPYIYEWVASVRYVVASLRSGSISAEHGLGLMKADKIGYSKDPLSVHYMQEIKKLFDPKGLLNPYKVRTALAHRSTCLVHD